MYKCNFYPKDHSPKMGLVFFGLVNPKFDSQENKMEIYVDDILLNDIDLNKTFNKSDGLNSFRQPHYVLLNLALGGDRGGSLENTNLPSKYLVDYVRIYQLK